MRHVALIVAAAMVLASCAKETSGTVTRRTHKRIYITSITGDVDILKIRHRYPACVVGGRWPECTRR